MPDMDGFKLLELIQFELDLPVLMMSANSDSSVVLRGIIHGAVDYLLKPVRIEELRNIWQHVVRRIGSTKTSDETPPLPSKRAKTTSTISGKSEDSDRVTETGPNKARKKLAAKKGNGKAAKVEAEKESIDAGSSKKLRVVWSAELHAQFVTAVNQLGIHKAVPKRILDLMGVQGLTRENVASHLQKYRLYLKRLQGNNGAAGPGFMNVPSSISLPHNRVNAMAHINGHESKSDDEWNDSMFRAADLSLPMSASDFLGVAGDDFVDAPDSAFDPALLSPLGIGKVKADGTLILEAEASEQMLNYFLQD